MWKVSQTTAFLFHKKSNRIVKKNWFKYFTICIKLSPLFTFLLIVATCARQAPIFAVVIITLGTLSNKRILTKIM